MKEDQKIVVDPQMMDEREPISSTITPVETPKSFWSRLPRFRHAPKIWHSFGIIAVLLVVLFVTVPQIGKQQDIRKNAANNGVRLTLVPSKITAFSNKEYTVAITINTGEEVVSAADLHLTFDPSKVEVKSIVPGNFLPVVLVQGKVVNGTTSITLGSQPTKPKKGSGVLAILKIKSLGQTTAITFSNATQIAVIGKTGNAVGQLGGLTITSR